MKYSLRLLFREFFASSLDQKIFLVMAMLAGACITADYAVVKPTTNSIFITSYGIRAFPFAWLAALPVNFIIVVLYNKFLTKIGCIKMMCLTTSVIISLNVYASFYISKVSWMPFFMYIWKDIYVLLMFQQLWSVIHSTISQEKAKIFYGIMFGVGGIGAVAGSFIPGFLAIKIGSGHLLFTSLPIYLLFTIFFIYGIRARDGLPHVENLGELKKEKANYMQGIGLIKNSKYLQFILIIVVCMQVTSTLMEFQFNTYLFQKIPLLDQRTEFCGRLFAAINSINILLQFFGSFLLVTWLGLKRSHLLIPSILSCNMLMFLIYPFFSVITYSFSVIKSFDYSIFSIIKEMLYSPLKIQEKFHAKALIDVFAYRTSKALASFIVLFMQTYAGFSIALLTIGNLAIFAIWLFAVFFLFREEKQSQII